MEQREIKNIKIAVTIGVTVQTSEDTWRIENKTGIFYAKSTIADILKWSEKNGGCVTISSLVFSDVTNQ